jgi:hypothetical protein
LYQSKWRIMVSQMVSSISIAIRLRIFSPSHI